MTTLSRFEIHQPGSALEASQMLVHYGDEAGIYAGGTELLLAMKHQALNYRHLIDLKVVPGLNSIEVRDGSFEIGATRRTAALSDPHSCGRISPSWPKWNRKWRMCACGPPEHWGAIFVLLSHIPIRPRYSWYWEAR